jgi:hypothetical protein
MKRAHLISNKTDAKVQKSIGANIKGYLLHRVRIEMSFPVNAHSKVFLSFCNKLSFIAFSWFLHLCVCFIRNKMCSFHAKLIPNRVVSFPLKFVNPIIFPFWLFFATILTKHRSAYSLKIVLVTLSKKYIFLTVLKKISCLSANLKTQINSTVYW